MTRLTLFMLALAACAPQRFAYAPVTVTSADVTGAPAARHPVPPDRPRGEIRVATFGITSAPGAGRAVHVRLVVTNRSDEVWTVDAAEQRLEVEHRTVGPSTTRYEEAVPAYEIKPGDTQNVDLLFPLPRGLEDAREVPGFDVVWAVRVGPRLVTERTAFERFLAARPPPDIDDASQTSGSIPRREPLQGPTGGPGERWAPPQPIR